MRTIAKKARAAKKGIVAVTALSRAIYAGYGSKYVYNRSGRACGTYRHRTNPEIPWKGSRMVERGVYWWKFFTEKQMPYFY